MNRGRLGSGLIEFAFGFSVLVVFFVGLAQIGYSVLVLNQLTAAVRAGARYAASSPFAEPGNGFASQVRNIVVYGASEPGAEREAQAPGLRPGNVDVTWSRDAAGVPKTITVAVKGYELPFLFRERTLDGRPKATVQYTGEWRPH